MSTHNVRPHTRQGKPVAGSTRKNPGRSSSSVVDAGRQDQARAAALADADNDDYHCEGDRSAAEARAEGRCTGITPHGPCQLPAEGGDQCEPHANDQLNDPRIVAGIAAHTASGLAASEAEHLGEDEEWAKACAQKLERAIIRTHAAADGAKAAATECDQIYDTSKLSGDYRRMRDRRERAKRLAREAREESITAAEPGCADDVLSASAMAQSLSAEARGCRDAMKAIVNYDTEERTYDEVMQDVRAMVSLGGALHDECVQMKDDETIDEKHRAKIAEQTSRALVSLSQLSFTADDIDDPLVTCRSQRDDARRFINDIKGAWYAAAGYAWESRQIGGDLETSKPEVPELWPR